MKLCTFDKSKYKGLNKVEFSAQLFSMASSSYCYVELYNATDGVSIMNSRLSTNEAREFSTIQKSENLVNSLPNKRILIYLRMKGTVLSAESGVYTNMKLGLTYESIVRDSIK